MKASTSTSRPCSRRNTSRIPETVAEAIPASVFLLNRRQDAVRAPLYSARFASGITNTGVIVSKHWKLLALALSGFFAAGIAHAEQFSVALFTKTAGWHHE